MYHIIDHQTNETTSDVYKSFFTFRFGLDLFSSDSQNWNFDLSRIVRSAWAARSYCWKSSPTNYNVFVFVIGFRRGVMILFDFQLIWCSITSDTNFSITVVDTIYLVELVIFIKLRSINKQINVWYWYVLYIRTHFAYLFNFINKPFIKHSIIHLSSISS